jgi:hypothetical protein
MDHLDLEEDGWNYGVLILRKSIMQQTLGEPLVAVEVVIQRIVGAQKVVLLLYLRHILGIGT